MKITTCCIKGCEEPVWAVAFCNGHYLSHRRYGHPLAATNSIEGYKRAPRPYLKERRAWRAAINRCFNPRIANYHYYGGRGIRVCDRWLDSFEAFYEDMGPAPSAGHSIDRIDVNGHYEPSNCRWATVDQQNRNQRHTVLSEEKVKEAHKRHAAGDTIISIAEDLGASHTTISQALKGQTWKEFAPIKVN